MVYLDFVQIKKKGLAFASRWGQAQVAHMGDEEIFKEYTEITSYMQFSRWCG